LRSFAGGPARIGLAVLAAFFGVLAILLATRPAMMGGNDPQPDGAAASFLIDANNVVKARLNVELDVAAAPPPAKPLAEISFDPNLDNGQDTLITSAEITAGFAHSVPPILPVPRFIAPAGDDLGQLAALTKSALDSAGYLTSMPDSTEVLVFAGGVSLPVEFDFELDPQGPVGDMGIDTNLASFSVAEPDSFAVLGIALGALGIAYRRRSSRGRSAD